MELTEACALLGVNQTESLPRTDRRYAVLREAAQDAGDAAMVHALDEAFSRVSAHHWEVVDPALCKAQSERIVREEERLREELDPKGWPGSWPVDAARDWAEAGFSFADAARWAGAGWPPEMVLSFFLGAEDASGQAQVGVPRSEVALPRDSGKLWFAAGIASIDAVYDFEHAGWSPAEVGQLGAPTAMACLDRGFLSGVLRAFVAHGVSGDLALRLHDQRRRGRKSGGMGV